MVKINENNILVDDEIILLDLDLFNRIKVNQITKFTDNDTNIDRRTVEINPLFYSVISFKQNKAIFQRHSLLMNPYLYYQYNYSDYNFDTNILMDIYQNNILNYLHSKNYLENVDYDIAKKVLYPEQQVVFEDIVNNRYGVIQLNTGFGKTVLATTLIYAAKIPALFIVDNNVLANQFIKTVKNFFNTKVNELDNSKATINKLLSLQEKEYYSDDEIFWVTTVQMLYRKIKEEKVGIIDIISKFRNIYNAFKIVIYDEAHTTGGAQLFSKTSILFKTPHLYGLTATPYNSGANKILFTSAFSDNIITLSKELEEKITEKLSKIVQVFYSTQMWYPNTTIENYQFIYQKNISKDKNFYKVVLSRIKNILNENQNRNILILVKMIETGKVLQKLIQEKLHKDVSFIFSKNKNSNENHQIIISTIDLGKKGLDIPRIDYIINTYPLRSKNSFYQIIGRALRKYENKNDIVYEEIIPKNYENVYKINDKYYNEVIKPKYGEIHIEILQIE